MGRQPDALDVQECRRRIGPGKEEQLSTIELYYHVLLWLPGAGFDGFRCLLQERPSGLLGDLHVGRNGEVWRASMHPLFHPGLQAECGFRLRRRPRCGWTSSRAIDSPSARTVAYIPGHAP